jgi:hypothetical protein
MISGVEIEELIAKNLVNLVLFALVTTILGQSIALVIRIYHHFAVQKWPVAEFTAVSKNFSPFDSNVCV